MGSGTEPITDDEIVYRRVSVKSGWYTPEKSPPLSPMAFNPRKDDTRGLSLVRAKSAEDAAMSPRGQPCYVVALKAGDLRAHGIEIVPRPLPDNPGHAEIPVLTYDNRRTDVAKGLKLLLATKLCDDVLGPFRGREGI